MTRLVQPARHVAAHAAESDDRELQLVLSWVVWVGWSVQRGRGSASACSSAAAQLGQAGVRIV